MTIEPSTTALRLALYQPDIPQNVGALLRLAACFALPVDLIAPYGFVWDDRRVRRAAMDYIDAVDLHHFADWQSYRSHFAGPGSGRLVLATTQGAVSLADFRFAPGDRLLLGRESAGVPVEVAEQAQARVRIPMRRDLRSINVAQAGAIMLFEALRQLNALLD